MSIVEKFDKDLGTNPDFNELEHFLFNLVQGIAHDFPQFLSKLSMELQPLLESKICGPRITAICFFVQILQTETSIDLRLREESLSNIINGKISMKKTVNDIVYKDVQ